MAVISLITNFLFLLVCLLLSLVMPSALFYSAGSFWMIVMGVMTGRCSGREGEVLKEGEEGGLDDRIQPVTDDLWGGEVGHSFPPC